MNEKRKAEGEEMKRQERQFYCEGYEEKSENEKKRSSIGLLLLSPLTRTYA